LNSRVNKYFLIHTAISSLVFCKFHKLQYGRCPGVENVFDLQLVNMQFISCYVLQLTQRRSSNSCLDLDRVTFSSVEGIIGN
jgi:hypothetical protein